MPITKQLTNAAGIVYDYHRINSIIVGTQDSLFATVSSYISKERATDRNAPVERFSFPIHTPITTGLVATAEALLVADPNCKLFGGTVTQDVVLTDLEQAKAKRKLAIESAKNVEMYAPKTTSLGVFDSTDADNNKLSIVIQVTQLAEAKGLPAVAGFKDTNGVWAAYTLEQLGQIALEMTAQVLPLYEKEAAKFAEIDAAVDVAAVEAVVW
jgi:hypothetical protein